MEYGYARCSTNSNKQDIDRQKRELIQLGIRKENIFWEYGTAERNDREKLQQLLETVVIVKDIVLIPNFLVLLVMLLFGVLVVKFK